MTMENIKEQIRLLQETLEQAKRQINNVEHNLYREITHHDIENLKEMGDVWVSTTPSSFTELVTNTLSSLSSRENRRLSSNTVYCGLWQVHLVILLGQPTGN